LQVDAKKLGEEKRRKEANKGALRALRAENKEATKLKGSIYVRTSFSNDKKKCLQARPRPQETVKCE
jgi:hypothetical protein